MKKSEIMYVEPKSGIASLEANIGRVNFSKTGKTLEYGKKQFQSLKGSGFKANYFDIEGGEEYWISGCRKDGNDGLYRTIVHVDQDVREVYWRDIRGMPERARQKSFVSAGKHKANGRESKNQQNNV